ncbi:hypothetical protein M0813_18277 [Anaeramoeba flamelloides]|uniref:Uncharacterized protein n=1 Tax=Anaeramoeba flamelloides TaxID=1746091 RepID=A0ABQ8YSP8_9EUKA|nr:hypothetical protein M0813_18277 [Anaeramoeba flamelloides]
MSQCELDVNFFYKNQKTTQLRKSSSTNLVGYSGMYQNCGNTEKRFSEECNCSLREAKFFLKTAKEDYKFGMGLYVLTHLITQGGFQKKSIKIKNIFEIDQTDLGGRNERKIIKTKTESQIRRARSNSYENPKTRGTTENSQTIRDTKNERKSSGQLQEEERDHGNKSSGVYNEFGRLDYNDLKRFLNNKPTPPWRERLRAFKSYDTTLVQGFPHAMFTRGDIVLDKKLFSLYEQMNKGKVSIKNLQRGVIAFFERNGFQKVDDRSRTKMVFHWKSAKN